MLGCFHQGAACPVLFPGQPCWWRDGVGSGGAGSSAPGSRVEESVRRTHRRSSGLHPYNCTIFICDKRELAMSKKQGDNSPMSTNSKYIVPFTSYQRNANYRNTKTSFFTMIKIRIYKQCCLSFALLGAW